MPTSGAYALEAYVSGLPGITRKPYDQCAPLTARARLPALPLSSHEDLFASRRIALLQPSPKQQ
jgi:hypothetical protein